MEATNRLKGLDLIDRVLEELWAEVHDIVQEAVIKSIPRKRNAKGKMVSEEALQITEKRKEAKGKGSALQQVAEVLEFQLQHQSFQ